MQRSTQALRRATRQRGQPQSVPSRGVLLDAMYVVLISRSYLVELFLLQYLPRLFGWIVFLDVVVRSRDTQTRGH